MKTMTCKQLGGACDDEFHAETWEEMKGLSKTHGIEMFIAREPGHIKAMQEMQELMDDPEDFEQWMAEKKALFDSLPQDD